MDTEKYIELEHKVSHGLTPSDEGPYYHHGWWESYKGSVKGKFLGVVIGTLIGALIGGIVVAAAALNPVLAGLGAMGAAMTIGSFAVAGLGYAMHEFSDIGKIVGSEAAQHYQQELRMKTFVKGQVANLKQEINELKALVKGEQPKPDPECEAAIKAADEEETDYRKSHYAKISAIKFNSLAFWKVALVGLAVGAGAGWLIGATGLAAMALEGIVQVSPAAATLASTVVFGAMGASFGLNRDFFRKIADKTDLLFKGVFNARSHALVRQHQINAGADVLEKINGHDKADDKITTTVLPDQSSISEANPDFRKRILNERALLSLDHTRATPQ